MSSVKKVLTVEQVVDVITKAMGVDRMDMIYRRSRKRELVNCRQITMYFLRKFVKSETKANEPLSYKAIGNYFKKHHATVIHSVEEVEAQAQTNKEFRANLINYNKMLERLGNDDLCVFCNRPLEKEALFY